MNELESLIQLNLTQHIGDIRLKALLDHFGSAEKVLSASKSKLMETEGISSSIAEAILEVSKDEVARDLELIRENNIDIITIRDKSYPENLVNIYSPPILLYVKGKLLKEDKNAIAIVGSRRATYYGLSTAENLAYKLAYRGITIVSGMARGIDTAAHKGALKAGGRTIAVLGSGFLNIYPPENKKLQDKISKNGAVISEFPMDTPPYRQNFPKRNRIISGLSLGVVVVEAAKRSGALITADLALEQGREVFAVPGKVKSATSTGTHNLIKQGAKLVDNIDDIIEELNLDLYPKESKSVQEPIKQLNNLSEEEKSIFSHLLADEPFHIDKLAEMANLSISQILGILMKLQIKGLVKELPGKKFVKKNMD